LSEELSGIGMWVGRGGVSLLAIRSASEIAEDEYHSSQIA